MCIAKADGGKSQLAVGIDDEGFAVRQRPIGGRFAVEGVIYWSSVDRREFHLNASLFRTGRVGGMDIVQVSGIVVVLFVVKLHHTDGALREFVKILFPTLCPLYFCQCRQSWQCHIFHLSVGRHILCPEVCLHANDESSQIFRFSLCVAVQ